MRNVLTWFGIQTGISTDEKGVENIPRIFSLSQNIPNPFNKRTTICYSIPRKTNVTLKIYNAAGQLVRTLVNGKEEPGYKNVIWNGLDRNNRRVAQGVYFYKLSAGNFRATKKVLVLR
ncbi:T9SS type A sorting domain-containing protein, partial [candidate division WOR-3 bacterium]|nr:T9SS type A sorting domain-containing protein [candidate division WOR-3 bacterium]